MELLRKAVSSRERAAALIIVLAFVVLLSGLVLAYLSRTTTDRQVSHGSFNQTKADQLVASAVDNIIGDLRQEIINGSTPTTVNGVTIYAPNPTANMIPQRSGNPAGVPNLIRRSVRLDAIPAPGLSSRASAVNSTTDISANGRSITSTRWNSHYLVPKKDPTTDDSLPIDDFTSATPDWVFVLAASATPIPTPTPGATVITSPSSSVIGRYAYAIYDEGGLLDMNVAGYPTGTTVTQSGRKGSLAFADLTTLPYPIPNSSSPFQIDTLVGWRNYGATQPSNNFPDTNFAANFRAGSGPALAYWNSVINNTSGFVSASGAVAANGRTDQMFLSRQQLIAFRKTTQFSANALQYLTSFSRESNSPSFSPSTAPGSTIDYATLATTSTATNPNFLLRRVTTSFTRFDGTAAAVGEPLVKTRFPLSRLAWITYKGPSASLATTDSVITALTNAGVSLSTIQAGTAANVKTCFGLAFPTGGTPGSAWTYTNPTGAAAATRILRLDEVATAGREPDFFELLQAGILSGSLGQNTGGGVSGGNVFPDIHMSNTTHHILSIGAAIIDQADPDSIPTRIQFNPSGTVWTAYGVENLPYITQLYPIAGASPDNPTKWATYLLFQLWNPHQNASTLPAVRLRVDGGIGLFAGGNSETWNASSTAFLNATGQSVTLSTTASLFSTATPLTTNNTTTAAAAPGLPAGGIFAAVAAPAVPTPTP